MHSGVNNKSLILAIETSCDETAACILKDGTQVISSVVASSRDLHEKTGGIVPEVAARKQVEFIVPVLDQTIKEALQELDISKVELIKKLDAIAVTYGPGLIGSLIVGVNAAKALSLAWNKPLIPVNHLIGHVYSSFLENSSEIKFPAVVLVVSGGHTDLILMKNHNYYQYLGGTLDDAAGEAFDKTARLLDISSYKLGGPLLSKKAAECENNYIAGDLPRPLINKANYDFSFSGLKTAVKYYLQKNPDIPKDVLACEFETAVVDVLVTKTIKAAKDFDAESVLIGGGVAANKPLRSRLQVEAKVNDTDLFVPALKLCGDTAEYIACAAHYNFYPTDITAIKANPSLPIIL